MGSSCCPACVPRLAACWLMAHAPAGLPCLPHQALLRAPRTTYFVCRPLKIPMRGQAVLLWRCTRCASPAGPAPQPCRGCQLCMCMLRVPGCGWRILHAGPPLPRTHLALCRTVICFCWCIALTAHLSCCSRLPATGGRPQLQGGCAVARGQRERAQAGDGGAGAADALAGRAPAAGGERC